MADNDQNKWVNNKFYEVVTYKAHMFINKYESVCHYWAAVGTKTVQ